MLTEREEYEQNIARFKAAIAAELVKMGVKEDAAVRAVDAQTRFGLIPNHVNGAESVHINVGGVVRRAYGTQNECAHEIRSTLPEEAFTAFDAPDPDEQSWAAYEARLNATSTEFSREELRKQAEQKRMERIMAGLPGEEPAGTSEGLARLRSEVSSFL